MSASVVVIDDNEDLRTLAGMVLSRYLNVEFFAYGSFTDVQSNAKNVLQSRVIIIDINLGLDKPDGVQVYHWLCENNFKGKVFFLTGHGRFDPIVGEAIETSVPILQKPIRNAEFIALIKEAMQT